MQETVGSCLKDGDMVNVLVRPNALLLQQALAARESRHGREVGLEFRV